MQEDLVWGGIKAANPHPCQAGTGTLGLGWVGLVCIQLRFWKRSFMSPRRVCIFVGFKYSLIRCCLLAK